MAQITPHPGDELLAREKGEKMKGKGLKCGSNLFFFFKSYSFNHVYCAVDEKLVSHTLPPIFFSTSLAERWRNEDGAEVA